MNKRGGSHRVGLPGARASRFAAGEQVATCGLPGVRTPNLTMVCVRRNRMMISRSWCHQECKTRRHLASATQHTSEQVATCGLPGVRTPNLTMVCVRRDRMMISRSCHRHQECKTRGHLASATQHTAMTALQTKRHTLHHAGSQIHCEINLVLHQRHAKVRSQSVAGATGPTPGQP